MLESCVFNSVFDFSLKSHENFFSAQSTILARSRITLMELSSLLAMELCPFCTQQNDH